MNKGLGFLYGVGLGAGLMYILDPDLGSRRRGRVRDKSTEIAQASRKLIRRTRDGIGQKARDVAERGRAALDVIQKGDVQVTISRPRRRRRAEAVRVAAGFLGGAAAAYSLWRKSAGRVA